MAMSVVPPSISLSIIWRLVSVASRRSVGLMDKVSASGAGDSRFESWADHSAESHAGLATALS